MFQFVGHFGYGRGSGSAGVCMWMVGCVWRVGMVGVLILVGYLRCLRISRRFGGVLGDRGRRWVGVQLGMGMGIGIGVGFGLDEVEDRRFGDLLR